MDPNPSRPQKDGTRRHYFATTHWSVVLAAGSDDSSRSDSALSELCRTYWRPVYEFALRWGYSAPDAEDSTQQFFARFLEKQQYRAANQARGRFRTFLLVSVKNFFIKERERASAAKRGGGATVVSLHEDGEDGLPVVQLPDFRTADRAFDRNWALALLSRARERLEAEYRAENKGAWFDHLERFLPGDGSGPTYAQAALQLGVPEGTIKSDVHRLKRRYSDLVHEEIAHTLSNEDQIEDELRHLRAILSEP